MDALTFVHKVQRRILGVPAQLVAQSLALPGVRAELDRRLEAYKKSYSDRLPRLSSRYREIAEGVRRSGVYITNLDDLGIPGSREMFDACAQLAKKYRALHLANALESKDAFQAGAEDLLDHPEIFLWGLSEPLLDIAEVYLSQPVGYDGLNLFYTKADGRETAARKWHRDIEDRSVLKVVVYINDVDENGGPLEVLSARVPGAESDTLPSYPVLTQIQLERRLGRAVAANDVSTCTGPAGTVIFAETGRHYHRGRPAVSRDRCAVFFNYFARPPLRPYFCERGTLSRRQIMKLAGSLNSRQLACLKWRDALPMGLRLVPPAPI